MDPKANPWTHEGFQYKNFVVQRVVEIPELQCSLIEVVHKPTGALILHIPNDDPENFFCLSFKTLPSSSNGVAHILEHTVLCGSKKFPVKDPFFSMNRRSLNTFMNAFTGADFTCYPAASQVPQDFYNLLEVYLDAVFHPTLSKMSFRQEGHRLEFDDPENPSTPLQRKGIVFNEMKGALNSAEARLHQMIDQALYPSSTYGYNYGGDPKEIPHLTYSELVEFHKKFYHPKQCLYFFYGDMPLEGHLDFLEEHAFNHVSASVSLPPEKSVTRYTKPLVQTGEYPLTGNNDDHTYVCFGWLTCDILKQKELLALSILDIVLMDNDASPLKRLLQSSDLCKQALSYLEDEKSEVPWIFLLKGCPPDASDEIEELFFSSLEEVIDDGISLSAIENAMHQLEFHRSEITGDRYPFGLTLFMRAALLKQHDVPPENGLTLHSHFAELRKTLEEDPHYFLDLLQKYLIDNPHRVRITLHPSATLGKEERQAEEEIVEKVRKELDEKEVETLVEQAKRLKAYQESMEHADLNVLPKIHIEEIPKKAREIGLLQEKRKHWDIFSHQTFTNEIVYADIHLPLPHINPEELPAFSLFTQILTQLGSGGNDYIRTLELMQAHTGGFGACLSLFFQADDHRSYFPHMIVRGKALERELPSLFQLFNNLFKSIDLADTDRLKELIEKHATALEGSLNQAALHYAKLQSASGLNVVSWVQQQWAGLPFYRMVRDLAKNLDQQLPPLIEQFSRFHQQVFTQKTPQLVLSCQQKPLEELHRKQFFGLFDHPTGNPSSWTEAGYSVDKREGQGRTIASPVAFIAETFETLSYTNPATPLIGLASCLFDNLVLHPRIREQGGAYGGGSSFNSMGGIFSFFSYRDPQIDTTLQTFQDAVEEIGKGEFNDEQLEEAKLEMVQAMDSPISPGSRASVAYQWDLQGKTKEARQTFRDAVLSATKEQVQQAIREHLKPKMNDRAPVVFASKHLLEEENKQLKKPLPIYDSRS